MSIGLTKYIESVVINSFVASTKGEDTTASGLRGDYYDNKDFTNLIFTRFDPQINFDFGAGSPDDPGWIICWILKTIHLPSQNIDEIIATP